MIVILDNLRSAHNVGSIFRTADAAGVTKIYLCGITPAPLDRFGRPVGTIAKVALGAEQIVAWERVDSTVSAIHQLQKDGFEVLGVEQHIDSVPYSSPSVVAKDMSRVALVLGNEVDGVGEAALKLCDGLVEIPMKGVKESLNVSVAFGIVVFRLLE